MTIAIMSAMHEENAAIVDAMQIENEQAIGSRTFISGQLCNQDIVVVFSHWGKVAASITATILVTQFNVREIIFTGVAGSINNNYSVGDIVIGKDLYQHDMDARPIIERHEIPLLGRAAITTSVAVQEKLKNATNKFLKSDFNQMVGAPAASQFNINNPTSTIADIASGDQFVSDSSITLDIANRLPGVACVEMEGAAVAQVCESFDVPFGLVRTISDGADESSDIDFLAFVSSVAKTYSLGILIRYLEQ